MQNLVKPVPKGKRRNFPRPVKKSPNRAEAFSFALSRLEGTRNRGGSFPKSVVFVRPNPRRDEQSILFLDHVPIPRDWWSFNSHTKVLTWKNAFNGGILYLNRERAGGVGRIGSRSKKVQVRVTSQVQYICKAALDCGIKRNSVGTEFLSMTWDTESADWKNAKWQDDRMILSYFLTFDPGQVGGILEFTFDDLITYSSLNPWKPNPETSYSRMDLAESPSGGNQYTIAFENNATPPDVEGDDPTYPPSVYPCSLRAVEPIGDTINGAMETNGSPGNGVLSGFEGVLVDPSVNGYYRVGKKSVPFGVFNGRMHFNGRSLSNAYVKGNVLHWNNLSKELQKHLGISESGEMHFNPNGSTARIARSGLVARRLSTDQFFQAIAQHGSVIPDLQRKVTTYDVEDITELDPITLSLMTPFEPREDYYVDVVQEAVRNDLGDIMNYYMDDDIWNLLFADQTRPTLEDYVINALNKTPEAAAWYTSLSTAVVSHGLAEGDDPNCEHLNGLRAGTWLNNEFANSEIYKANANELFKHHWRIKEPETTDFLIEQDDKADEFAPEIDIMVQDAIDDINANIVDTGDEDDLIPFLENQARQAGEVAKSQNLFWAYFYYDDLTDVVSLTNLASLIYLGSDAQKDELAREIQKNLTVLTALDDSDTFAQEYLTTINTFLGSNVMMQLIDLDNVSAEDYELVLYYLEQFVEINITNEDEEIQELAKQLQALIAEDEFEQNLKDALDLMGGAALGNNALWSFSYICEDFLVEYDNRFKDTSWEKWGNRMGSLMIGGTAVMTTMNLMTSYKNWDDLSEAEQAEVVINTVQMGTQIMKLVVSGSAKLPEIFSASKMTKYHSVGGYGEFILSGPTKLAEGLINISKYFAYLMRDLAGVIGIDGKVLRKLKTNALDIANKKWTKKVFGKNFNEFIGSRLGPMFSLAGIGFAINGIVQGDTGLVLAADIMEIIAASLEIFAIVGGWFVAGTEGFMVAVIGAAGALAVVAAIVGIALLLINAFTNQPPNPIETFVNDYADPAGFAVVAKCSALDYVIEYEDNGYVLYGATMENGGQVLVCGTDGTLSMGTLNNKPDTVLIYETDGWGRTQFFALAPLTDEDDPINYALSLMNDGSVAFAPVLEEEMTEPAPDATREIDTANVSSQTWLSDPIGSAVLSSDGTNLSSLDFTLQAMIPDGSGGFTKGDFVKVSGGSLVMDASGSTFKAVMKGMAPNYMNMNDIKNVAYAEPNRELTYSPDFGLLPSEPVSYAHSGGTLPPYLEFDADLGVYSYTTADLLPHEPINATITATSDNGLGSDSADFEITCKEY